MKIFKTDTKHKTILFIVLAPDEVDRNGDLITKDEIIKTAHEFGKCMCEKYLNIDHNNNMKIDKQKYDFVESFVVPFDMEINNETIKEWTWFVWIKFKDEKLFQAVQNWEFVWVSMEGYMVVEE